MQLTWNFNLPCLCFSFSSFFFLLAMRGRYSFVVGHFVVEGKYKKNEHSVSYVRNEGTGIYDIMYRVFCSAGIIIIAHQV